jgi:oxepin-CoA hydrolase/3-oxo-5,6-dehydrosuberyl-CoA semialdehyde dehydrogenase
MLEKLAPTWLAGMPAIIKPATATAQVTQAMVKSIVDSGLVPDGAISLICGGAGSARPSRQPGRGDLYRLRQHRAKPARAPEYCGESIPFTMEADSLNCCVLGKTSRRSSRSLPCLSGKWREMTAKAGQKCTAIRRIIVPQARLMP